MSHLLDPLANAGSELHGVKSYLRYDDIRAAWTSFVGKYNAGTQAPATEDYTNLLGGSPLSSNPLTEPDKKVVVLAGHVYRFLPRQIGSTGEREQIVGSGKSLADTPWNQSLFDANTGVSVRDFYDCWRRFTTPTSQNPFAFLTVEYDTATVFSDVRSSTQLARVEAARSQAIVRAPDVMMLLLACVVRDHLREIRNGYGITSSVTPFERRMGIDSIAASGTVTLSPIGSGTTAPFLAQAVMMRCRRKFVVPNTPGTTCLEPFADRMSFTAALKSNDKWQDAVDVVTAKCRRSGIMTYVILVCFLVYLFGSVFMLRSGQPPETINAAVGVTAAVVCGMIVAYYLLQFFRIVKPPVWLP